MQIAGSDGFNSPKTGRQPDAGHSMCALDAGRCDESGCSKSLTPGSALNPSRIIGQLADDCVRRTLTLTQINSFISTSIYFLIPPLGLESIHARFSPSPYLIP